MSAYEDLIDFRTAYLRLVARVWADDSSGATQGYHAQVTSFSPEQLANHFATDYGFASAATWGGLEVSLIDDPDGPQWDPAQTGGWFGRKASQILLKLPLDPQTMGTAGTAVPPAQWVVALARFYDQRPTLFGEIINRQGILPARGLGDFEQFLEFGAVTLRALALAWKSTDFRQRLLADAMLAFQGYLGYTPPWTLKIAVQAAANTAWNSNTSTWNFGPNDKNRLTLALPATPAPVDIQPIALSNYNSTGEDHPFTCCA